MLQWKHSPSDHARASEHHRLTELSQVSISERGTSRPLSSFIRSSFHSRSLIYWAFPPLIRSAPCARLVYVLRTVFCPVSLFGLFIRFLLSRCWRPKSRLTWKFNNNTWRYSDITATRPEGAKAFCSCSEHAARRDARLPPDAHSQLPLQPRYRYATPRLRQTKQQRR